MSVAMTVGVGSFAMMIALVSLQILMMIPTETPNTRAKAPTTQTKRHMKAMIANMTYPALQSSFSSESSVEIKSDELSDETIGIKGVKEPVLFIVVPLGVLIKPVNIFPNAILLFV